MNTIPVLPDETIYSLVTRLAGLRVNSNARVFNQKWLGHYGMSINQQLPVGLPYLEKLTGSKAQHLLEEHTYFPLYSMSIANPQKLKEIMLDNYGFNLASTANVSQLKFTSSHCHRYCAECVRQDVDLYGVAYWHLAHQFTGVTCCVYHGLKLFENIHNNRVFRLPPQHVELQPEIAESHAVRFAYFVLQHNEYYKNEPRYEVEVYDKDLSPFTKERGLVRGTEYNTELTCQKINEFSHLLFGKQILTKTDIYNLLNKSNHYCHPLKPLLFQYTLQQIETLEPNRPTNVSTFPLIKPSESEVLKLLHLREFSLREVAKRAKCSIGFVLRIAKLNKIEYLKRTQFIDEQLTSEIKEMAINGECRKMIAEITCVSVGAVEQIIESTPHLSAWRQYQRMLTRRGDARKAIQNTMDTNDLVSRNEIKKLCYADYTWLYKYDQSWLYRVLPRPRNYTKK
ncbi:TniQ family protein [Alteromonas stellipolaris]|uniref:TniQ family protein n=1 Tax=Alteromonas stellipolaris TaxID=233316 RepID=UPI001DB5A524|nr:TniQ family protein [Alteromonas stellipolaris]MBZ2163333.1 TniQ family protein [Alteromonas stellipolaris]